MTPGMVADFEEGVSGHAPNFVGMGAHPVTAGEKCGGNLESLEDADD